MIASGSKYRLPGETSEKLLCLLTSEGFDCAVYQYFPSKRVQFIADGDIDADGAYQAYHPNNSPGLDNLNNAGHPGHWFGIVTDRYGIPFIQDGNDPAPGFYISATSYQWSQFDKNDPHRYLDSQTVPFIVVENYIRHRAKGIVLGCKARITNLKNGKSIDAVVGDLGPLVKLGEISINAANLLDIPGNPRTGGVDDPILKYELWPDVPAVIQGKVYNLIPSIAA